MSALQGHCNVYESLQLSGNRRQIRLLRLLDFDPFLDFCAIAHWDDALENPLKHAEPLRFKLGVYDCDSVPAYDAISYAWGEANHTRTVVVNSVELSVGENCHYALRQARLQDGEYIWIDAICINQLDLEEKGQQVAMMYSIFSGAGRVLACIGPSDPASDRILESLQRVQSRGAQTPQDIMRSDWSPYSGGNPSRFWTRGRSYNPPLLKEWRDWVSTYKPCTCTNKKEWVSWDTNSRAQFCEDFNALFQRPYFHRLWVAQEIHGGGAVCLFLVGTGSFSLLDLQDIRKVASAIFKDFEMQDEKPLFLLEMLQMLEEMSWKYTEGPVPHLRLAQHLLCSDPRDRVHGTLGIHRGDVKASIVPDYNKSAFELALDLSRLYAYNFYGLQHSVEALEIGFHHSRLMPYLIDNSLAPGAIASRGQRWEVSFKVWRIIDKLQPLTPQDVMKTQESMGSDLSGEEHKTCEAIDPSDYPGFATQCHRLLRENRVTKGVAVSQYSRDEWVVPAAVRVGDIILSVTETSTGGSIADHRFSNTLGDLAVVVRIGPADERIMIVGFATCIPDSQKWSMSMGLLRRWEVHSRWRAFTICFEATVEEMIPLAIPQRDSMLHARHSFKMPNCTSMLSYRRDSLYGNPAYWSYQDGQGLLSDGGFSDRDDYTGALPAENLPLHVAPRPFLATWPMEMESWTPQDQIDMDV